MKRNGFITVLKRECKIMISKPLYLFTTLLFPLFALLFMTTIFGNGLIDNIPVAIVDEDNSKMSREITRQCSAVSEIKVTEVFHNTAEAREALLSKRIYAYLIIPDNFQADVMANRNCQLVLCYHYAFLSVGSEVLQGFLKTLRDIAIIPLKQTTDFLGIDNRTLETIASPIIIDSRPLYNPSLNYSSYLTFPYFWVLFQILILLNIAYSFGNDFKSEEIKTSVKLLDNRFGLLVIAKIIPYLTLFSIIAFFSNVMMFNVMGLSLKANILTMLSVCILFIAATISVSLFIFSLYPNLPVIISFISMFGSLGATFAGVTFPVNAMYPVFEIISQLFPIRHFVSITDYLRYDSGSFVYYWKSLVILIALCLVLLLAILLLKRKFNKMCLTNNE